ncbi:MAG: sugar ABC transporter substrate-binding protein [Candidatus Margulisiibacteriota bacterium]|jgi:multiple sugar transport system substrate-binding protein
MFKKSLILISLVLISSLLFLTGCGKGLSTGPKKVTMWIMPNSQEPEKDLTAVLEPFTKANPNIQVEIVSLDWGSAWQKITAAATSGTGPDIVQLGSTWVGMVSSMEALSDLKDNVNKVGGKDIFVPLAWETSGLVSSNKVTAVPWIVDARAMFYRTDVFKKLGLGVKDLDTWESFELALEKIKKANLTINGIKVDPLGITGKNDWNIVHNLAPWIWSGGGNFFTDDYKKGNLAKSDAAKGVAFYIGLTKKGYVPLSCLEKNSYQISSEFSNGSYAVYFDGPYALKTLTTPSARGGTADLPVAKNFGVAPYPQGPKGRFTYGGGSTLSLFKYSQNKEAAWKVIEYLTTDPAAQIAYAKVTGFLPATRKAFEDPYFTSDPQRKVFSESVNFAKNYPCISYWGALEMTTLPRRFGLMWSEAMSNVQKFGYKEVLSNMETADKEIDSVLGQ